MGCVCPRSPPRPGRSPIWSRVTPATPLAFLPRSMGGCVPTLRPRDSPSAPRAGLPAKRDPDCGSATVPLLAASVASLLGAGGALGLAGRERAAQGGSCSSA
jgi:hypothetical protein